MSTSPPATEPSRPLLPQSRPHTPFEDVQGIFTGCLFAALALVMFRESTLLTGGTTGLSFLIHYLSGWRLGLVMFLVNLPFYAFGLAALGKRFTFKTFCAVGTLSLFTELIPGLVHFDRLDPVFAAVMGGLLAGIGILILMRHGASLGGSGVLAIYLQKTRGWRAGSVQMSIDVLVLSLGLLVVSPGQVGLSILSAAALNLVIGINHRPDRYFGF